jgi:hypothetical protein
MRFRDAMYVLMLTAMCVAGIVDSACPQIPTPSPTANKGSVHPPTTVDVELMIKRGPTAEMHFTFKPDGTIQSEVLAVVAFDIAVEHQNLTDITRDRPSLSAVIVDSVGREVWFGKAIDKGQGSASLKVQLPEIIKPNDPNKDYILRFKLVPHGILEGIAKESTAVSQSQLGTLSLELPKGWEMVDAAGYKWDKPSPTSERMTFSGDKAQTITVRFKRDISPWLEWMQEHIGEFATALIVVLMLTSAIIRGRLEAGSSALGARAASIILVAALTTYMLIEYMVNANQGWFERNWWAVSASIAGIISIVMPMEWINVVLNALKKAEGKSA